VQTDRTGLRSCSAARPFVIATVGINIVANFISPAFDFSNVKPQEDPAVGALDRRLSLGAAYPVETGTYNAHAIDYNLGMLGALIEAAVRRADRGLYFVAKQRVGWTTYTRSPTGRLRSREVQPNAIWSGDDASRVPAVLAAYPHRLVVARHRVSPTTRGSRMRLGFASSGTLERVAFIRTWTGTGHLKGWHLAGRMSGAEAVSRPARSRRHRGRGTAEGGELTGEAAAETGMTLVKVIQPQHLRAMDPLSPASPGSKRAWLPG